MTFEEFFKKKKINLVTLERGEPALLSEFKVHFEKMGEKSFDHTKKYWFNKLRLRFPAPPEVKVEKAPVDNTPAEHTIKESTVEPSPPPANIGFKPKFRAGLTKPAETAPQPKEDTAQTTPPPAVGFKPRFKAGVTKPAESAPEPTLPASAENTAQTAPPAPLGFKPKFKAGITKTAAPVAESEEEPKADEPPTTEQTPEDEKAKPAYKPRFNMKNIKPKDRE